MSDKDNSVFDKKYTWPDSKNVGGPNFNQAVYIGESIRVLGCIIHDFAKMLEEKLSTTQDSIIGGKP